MPAHSDFTPELGTSFSIARNEKMLSISKCHGSRLPFGQCQRFCGGACSQQHHRRLSLEQAKVASLGKLQLPVPFPKTMADLPLEAESQMNSSGF